MDSLLSSFSLTTNDGCGLVVTFSQIISLGILTIDGATFTSFFKLAHSVRSTEIINFVELASDVYHILNHLFSWGDLHLALDAAR